MNIDDAKRIPLSIIFEKMNTLPAKQTEKDAWFIAPWRDEKTASLHVNVKANVWYDHGEGIGGDGINLVCHMLKCSREDHNVPDALRWLRNMTFQPIQFKTPVKIVENKSYWTLIRTEAIEDLALTRYLTNRGISLPLAGNYVTEAYVRNSENNIKLFAIGFKNEEGGYELRNRAFQSCIAPKTITFIRGKQPKPKGIHLFEGFMDFLTVVTINKGPLKDDAIILNSVNCIAHALPYIKDYGYRLGYTWLDNDHAGNKATATLADFFKTQAELQHKPMNKTYLPHKDVNAWHMHNLNLTL